MCIYVINAPLLLGLYENDKTNENPKHVCPHCFSLCFILQSCNDLRKMSELTERSKCVFQAKLAEQAERYDGASVHSSLLFYFERISVYTHARVEREHSVKMDPISLLPFFVPIRLLSLFSLSRAFVVISHRRRVHFSLSLSLSLTLFCVNLPFSCRDDRGVEEALRDSGHRVDGAFYSCFVVLVQRE